MYKNYCDIIPIVNSILSILVISQKNVKNIKIGQIVVSILWIVYDIVIFSYMAAISEIVIIIFACKGLTNKPKMLCEKNVIIE